MALKKPGKTAKTNLFAIKLTGYQLDHISSLAREKEVDLPAFARCLLLYGCGQLYDLNPGEVQTRVRMVDQYYNQADIDMQLEIDKRIEEELAKRRKNGKTRSVTG